MNGQLNCIDLKKSSKNSTCKAFYSVNAVKLLPLGFDKFKGKMLLRNTTKLLRRGAVSNRTRSTMYTLVYTGG